MKPYVFPSPPRRSVDRDTLEVLLEHAESNLTIAVQRLSHLDSKANFLLGTSAGFLSFLMGACFLSISRLAPALSHLGQYGWPWYERVALFLLPVACLSLGIGPTFAAIAASLRSLQTPVARTPPPPLRIAEANGACTAVDVMRQLVAQYDHACAENHELLENKSRHLVHGARLLLRGLPWLIISTLVFTAISGALAVIDG